MWPGYVERSYKACDHDKGSGSNNDPDKKIGDQCWGTENATLSLNGHSSELVKDDKTGAWHLQSDDGSRVDHFTGASNGDNNGEYWRVTTTDGTRYYFGRNRLPGWASGDATTNSTWTVPVYGNNSGEPCHAAAFADSWCRQAWRWNLDYVVDPHGNAISYSYGKETGHYGRDADPDARTAYTRGGYLTEAAYGFTDGHAYDAKAPAKVVFGVSDRCAPNTTCDTDHTSSWPDTPWDQDCLKAPCTDKITPVFFTQKRLTTITTQVLKSGSYQNVDRWTLGQSFLDTGDNDAKPLWLKSITHAGLDGGTVTLPAVTFDGTQMANRVDTSTDGLSALNRYRITSITSESGGVTDIGYSVPQCKAGTTMPSSPDSDTLRCMPTYWYPPGEDKKLDYFHKYVVTEVRSHDPFGGSVDEDTHYVYEGSPAWHYDDNPMVPAKSRTWSQWRGYQKVLVRHGAAGNTRSETEYLYLRGMDGDRQADGSTRSVTVTDSQGGTVTDSNKLQGFQREKIVHDGVGGKVLSDTITDPWTHGPTATQTADGSTRRAWMLNTGTTTTRSLLSNGSWGVKQTTTSYNSDGLPTKVDDLGDTSTSADNKCVRTTYTARNTSKWILNRPSEVETDAVRCSVTPQPSQVISHTRTYYDGSTTLGAAVSKGDITRTEALTSWNGSTPVYSTSSTLTYDSYGRALTTTDALDRTTRTTFTPASGGPVTATTATDPIGDTTTTTLDPANGQTLSTVDANGRRTDVTYDALGRLTAAWLPGRTKGTDDPNVKYSYDIRNDAASVVTTQSLIYTTITKKTSYETSYALYDGLMRLRQTQTPAEGGGRMITDTTYDDRGLKAEVSEPYYNDQAPSSTLVGTDDQPLPAATDYTYDGTERQTAAIFKISGTEKWRTTTAYPGADRVDVTPPAGGTATSTLTNARGETTELRQYHGPTPTGDYDATTYTYTPAGKLASLTDPAGNIWRYSYDTRGYKVKSEDPDTGTSTYTYDNGGELTSTTDARGITLTYSYDKLGRKTGEYAGSTSGTQLAGWVYDTLPGGKGLLTSSTRYNGNDAYTEAVTGYNSAGRPTGSSVTIPASQGALAGTYTDSTTYNPDGSVDTVTLPAAGDLKSEVLHTLYDSLGNDAGLYSSSQMYVYGVTYNHDGSLSQRLLGAYGSRVSEDYTYETGTHRLVRTDAVPEKKGYVSNISYTYDPAGNITKAVDNPDNNPDTQCYRYDYLDRLTDAWTPKPTGTDGSEPGSCAALPSSVSGLGGPADYWHTYSYDKTGNRTGLVEHLAGGDTTVTSTYPAAGTPQPHTLSSTVTTSSVGPGSTATEQNTYSYDAAGNTTKRVLGGDIQTLTWNSEGDLATFQAGNKTTSYSYDAAGSQLVRHDPDGSATLYLPDGTEVHAPAGGGAATATRYYTHLGDTIAVRTAAGVTWLINDPNGTDTVAVDGDTLEATHRYTDPFGQPRATLPNWIGDHGFVGGVRDPNTGLTNLGAREYDPSIGRFLSADPIADTGDPQQLNGYAYANNSPVIHNDASGQILACGGLGGSDPSLACRDGSTHPNGNNAGPVNWGWAPGADTTPYYDYVGRHGTTLHRNHNGSYSINGIVVPYDGPRDALAFAKAVDAATAKWQQSHRGFPDGADQSVADVLNMMLHACVPEHGGGICGAAFTNQLKGLVQTLNAKRVQAHWGIGDKILYYVAAGVSAGAAVVMANTGGEEGIGVEEPEEPVGTGVRACNSFAPDTRVQMADGSAKPIDQIKIGDKVVSTDPVTGKTTTEPVVGLIVGHGDKDLVKITVGSVDKHGHRHSGVLIATANHPFWDPTTHRWVTATDLHPAEQLRTLHGITATVAAIVRYTRIASVNNLTVAGNHTYYVRIRAASILVHNCPNGGYNQPPKNLKAFPNARLAQRKTAVRGGGGLRKRWKDSKGNIYEWDSQHGAVEKYNKRGKHLGEFNPNTGAQTKPADPNRKVVP